MTAPRLAVVFNPLRIGRERLQSAIAEWELEGGWRDTLWLPTTIDGSTAALVEGALGAGCALVLAAGGDGTVSEVAAAMRQSGVPLGILPSGTANLLARNLHLPLNNLVASARIAFTGVDRPIDVGVLTYRLQGGATATRPYFVMAGFGIDADMVAGTDVETKTRFGWLAYVSPILRSAARRSRASVTWSIDSDAAITARLHTLVVGNSGTITAGLRMLPTAELDDGLLDVLALRSLWGRDRVRFLNWVLPYQGPRRAPLPPAPRIHPKGAFRYGNAHTVTMTLHDPVLFQADGDLLGTVEWAEFSLDPLAVTVRVA